MNNDTILVVDDELPSLKLMVGMLTAEGYQVRPANSGEVALALVAAEPPDLILLDIRMPGMDGFEVLRRLKAREESRNIPVIFLSVITDSKVQVEGLRLGAVDFIAKPFQLEELRVRVGTHLALSRANVSLKIQAAALRQANEQLQSQIVMRQRIEDELRANLDQAERARRALLSVTEDQRAGTKSLKESEQRFRGMVEQSIAGIYIIQDNKLAYANPRFAEIFGFGSAEEPTGRGAASVIAEIERAAVIENIRKWLKGDARSISYGTTGLRKDGSTLDIGVHAARASYHGRPAIIGMVQDVSDKKRAEEEIQRYVEQLKTAFMSTVKVATTLSEMRDPYTAGHEHRVGEIAAAIGTELGFGAQRREGLKVAGYLHDIGKITIPSEILSKPGKLSAIEYQLIQGHPRAGYEVLKDVMFPWPVAEAALQHHERMDGSGYPQRLKGESILLEARIMAVADVVEAMCSHRPYRPELGIDKALAEIERGRGTVYDPVVADACLKLFREMGYAIPA